MFRLKFSDGLFGKFADRESAEKEAALHREYGDTPEIVECGEDAPQRYPSLLAQWWNRGVIH